MKINAIINTIEEPKIKFGEETYFIGTNNKGEMFVGAIGVMMKYAERVGFVSRPHYEVTAKTWVPAKDAPLFVKVSRDRIVHYLRNPMEVEKEETFTREEFLSKYPKCAISDDGILISDSFADTATDAYTYFGYTHMNGKEDSAVLLNKFGELSDRILFSTDARVEKDGWFQLGHQILEASKFSRSTPIAKAFTDQKEIDAVFSDLLAHPIENCEKNHRLVKVNVKNLGNGDVAILVLSK